MIDRPIIIIGAPRSGTTILQRCLAMHPALWHLRAESHGVLEGPFHPDETGRASNRCTGADAGPSTARRVRRAFYQQALNLNRVMRNPALFFSGSRLWRRAANALAIKALGAFSKWSKPKRVRLLEKTPKNTLRVPLLNRLFPDALFVWNRRRPAENVDSLIAGWETVEHLGSMRLPSFARVRFARAGYAVAGGLNLQDYTGEKWKFALVPEWPSLEGKTVADVAAWQYYQCNHYALRDLDRLDEQRIFAVRHETFVAEPVDTVKRIFAWAGLPESPVAERFAANLPRVNSTRNTNAQSPDRETKALRHPDRVDRATREISGFAALQEALGYGSATEMTEQHDVSAP
jgi:hypothetical protein